ncbi:MAG TPA: ATP-binding protein [Blastocatellia bacterium]|nr:ATP-binding protein [Blastocatellia bacterium]
MENPFTYGRELGLDELVNRQEELKLVVNTIKAGEKLFLIGPRRYGKTSLLRAAAQVCEGDGHVVLRFNVEAYPSLQALTAAVFAAGAAALTPPTAKAATQLKAIFTRLKPEFSVDLIQQQISASFGLSAETQAEQIPLLVDVLNGLEEIASKQKRKVGIVLDEFQQIIELGGQAAEGQLRAAIQTHRKIGYVFAGSKTRMLIEMTTDHARPFYRLGARCFLGAIPNEELLVWLVQQFAKGNFRADEATAQTLVEIAEAVPYDVQKLAFFCWIALSETRQKKLTAEMVRAAAQRIIEQDNPLYTQSWNQLSGYQKTALLTVAEGQVTGLTSKTVLKRTGLTGTTMQKTIEALKAKNILRDEETIGKISLRFEDPFFKRWISFVTKGYGFFT